MELHSRLWDEVVRIEKDIASLPEELRVLIVDHLAWPHRHPALFGLACMVVGCFFGMLV